MAHHRGLCWLFTHTTHTPLHQQQNSLNPIPWFIFLHNTFYHLVCLKHTHTDTRTHARTHTKSVFTICIHKFALPLEFMCNVKPNTCIVFRVSHGMCTAVKNLPLREHVLIWGWTLPSCSQLSYYKQMSFLQSILCHVFRIFCVPFVGDFSV